MSFNTIKQLKEKLLLEDENQTVEDDTLQNYLDDAQEDLYSAIGRSKETDVYELGQKDIQGTDDKVTLSTFFRIKEIKRIIKEEPDGETSEVAQADYSIVHDSDAVEIKNLEAGQKIHIQYIPVNYRLAELALAIEALLTRLNPFSNEENTRQYAIWRERKTNYLEGIKSHFGTGRAKF